MRMQASGWGPLGTIPKPTDFRVPDLPAKPEVTGEPTRPEPTSYPAPTWGTPTMVATSSWPSKGPSPPARLFGSALSVRAGAWVLGRLKMGLETEGSSPRRANG